MISWEEYQRALWAEATEIKAKAIDSSIEVLRECPFCQKKVIRLEIRDASSWAEFRQSGLCQACQDDFFGKDEKQ